ncbi:GDSL-type esterase/lipase family protein [Salinimicrobium sp. GXAS 041]|uniref:SGNH/GDSL hydrolase family protein n=1 Tax=Salinimicrobium sp. GXAS 041 TaxID=3400806 RepID=UPI003C784BF6
MHKLLYIFAAVLLVGCNETEKADLNFFPAKNDNFKYSGRTEAKETGMALINSAASVSTRVFGDSCVIYLESGNDQHYYVSLQLNNGYLGRYRIEKDSIKIPLPKQEEGALLQISKDTEASNGAVIFKGLAAAKIKSLPKDNRPEIEFIGNSITCGMGADLREIDCGEGEWYDQHNAYLAYGPRVARALDVNFELSCVSGMGMYRNWNDEDQPVMPNVYPNLYLNSDTSKKADLASDSPEIVSIALGTNDLSLGDGEKERTEFDPEIFTQNYIAFVETIFNYYPKTKVALISSPMIGEKEDDILVTCLMNVKAHFEEAPVFVFNFESMDAGGCTSHPDIEDHRAMAQALIPFYKEILNL